MDEHRGNICYIHGAHSAPLLTGHPVDLLCKAGARLEIEFVVIPVCDMLAGLYRQDESERGGRLGRLRGQARQD